MSHNLSLFADYYKTMTNLETTLGELDNLILSFSDKEMSRLLIKIVGNYEKLTVDTCKKIYGAYVKLARTNSAANVIINVEGLKGGKCGQPGEELDLGVGSGDVLKIYKNVVLGGTFDRLHVGHKILLTEAVVRCSQKLTVGVTDHSMIKGKKLWELIEPVDVRIANVLDFLKNVDGGLVYDVVPISDMFGPTQTDPDLDLLVVSAETVKGGDKVNQVRGAKGMKVLDVHVIDLVEQEATGEADELKYSSSNQRLKLLGTRLRPPLVTKISQPYLIGLTGGIASGKSSVAKKLESLGAGLVDCDKIAHGCYKKGTGTFQKVVDHFGPGVVGEDGEINRRALGNIVFSSEVELDKLNQLLWPEIIKESLNEARKLYEVHRKEIVVLEAAVLLRAGWQKHVHEIWTCIIPPEEAVSRVVRRNNISEDAARARLAAQPSNSEQVAIANVIFYTLYSYDFTGEQIKKAWTDLLAYLSTKQNKL